jgi:hypothetical protein
MWTLVRCEPTCSRRHLSESQFTVPHPAPSVAAFGVSLQCIQCPTSVVLCDNLAPSRRRP